MFNLKKTLTGLLVMFTGALVNAQELPDLLQSTEAKVKYGYTHETFSLGDNVRLEDWLHLRLGDLTGSLEMRGRDQHRITMNTTLGRLLNVDADGLLGVLLNKLQFEGRSESKRADWLLIGAEIPIVKRFNLYLAGVANDAGAKRILFGPMLYWAPCSYSTVLFYPSSGMESGKGAVQLRNHMDFDDFWIEANGMVKEVDHKHYFGVAGKVGWGPIAFKAETNPKYEGGDFDRSLYGLDVSLNW